VFPGWVEMTPERYALLAEAAGEWLDGPPRDSGSAVGTSSGYEQRCVYIVANRDDLVCYVGKSAPDDLGTQAAHRRILQHLRHWAKAEEWSTYWVLPLRCDVPETVIDRLEREGCRLFGVRLRNRMWRKAAARLEAERLAAVVRVG